MVVCGAGAAGTELSFAIKTRWSKLFGTEIPVKLLAFDDTPLPHDPESTRNQINESLKNKGILVESKCVVKEVQKDKVILADGREFTSNVTIWATEAAPHGITTASDLEIMDGYFKVNNFLQSTSHSNVFAGGDCITMEHFADKGMPTKAGSYAIREGPILAENITDFLANKPLQEFLPQMDCFKIMTTGEGKAIGHKFGKTFTGRWVWKMKDFIDKSFVHLFDPKNLFVDYETKGMAEKIDNFLLNDEQFKRTKKIMRASKAEVY